MGDSPSRCGVRHSLGSKAGLFAAALLIAALSDPASAQLTWDGEADRNWNNPVNWSGGGNTTVPNATTTCTIGATAGVGYPLLNDPNATYQCSNLRMTSAAATLTFDTTLGNITLIISRDMNATNAGATINRIGSTANLAQIRVERDWVAAPPFDLGPNSEVLFNGARATNPTINLTNPITNTVLRFNLPATGGGSIATFVTTNPTYGGLTVQSGEVRCSAAATPLTHTINGNVTISGGILVICDGTNNIQGTLNVSGSFTQTAGTVEYDHATIGELNVGGDWTQSGGTFNQVAGRPVAFRGAGPHTVNTGATPGFIDVTFGERTGAVTTATTTLSNAVQVRGALRIRMSGGTHTLNGGSATLTMAPGSTWTKEAGAVWNAQTGTVVWQSANPIGGAGGETWYNLTVDNVTGTITPATMTVRNDLRITNTVNSVLDGTSKTITVGGRWINERGPAGFTETGSTVILSDLRDAGSSASQIATAETFNNLTIGKLDGDEGGTADSTSILGGVSPVIVLGTFRIEDLGPGLGANFNAGANTVLEVGSAGASGTFTIVNLAAGQNRFVPGTGSSLFRWYGGALPDPDLDTADNDFNNLETLVPSPTTLPAGATIRIAGDLTVTSGTFNAGNATIQLGDDFTNNSTFMAGTSTLVLTGASAVDDQVITGSSALTLYNVQVNKAAGTARIGVNTTIDGAGDALDILSGTFSLSGFTLFLWDNLRVRSGGTLQLTGTSELRAMSATPQTFLIEKGGTFRASGSSVVSTGAARFAFTVDGNIDVTGLTFSGANSNGLRVNLDGTLSPPNSNLIALNNVIFPSVDTTTTPTRALFLTVTSGAFTATLEGHQFNYGAAAGVSNVRFERPTGDDGVARTLTMLDSSGPLGGVANGEANDDDSQQRTGTNEAVVDWVAAKVWEGGQGVDVRAWQEPLNWNPDGVPGPGDAVRIPAVGVNSPIIRAGGADAVAGSVDVQSSAALDIEGGRRLSIARAFTLTGVLNAAATSTVAFTGTSQQSIPPATYGNIEVSNTSATGATFTGPGTTTILGSITVTNGATAGVFGSPTLNVAGNWVLNGTGRFVPGTSTVVFNSTTTQQLLSSDTASKTFDFNNLTISNTFGNGTSASLSAGGTATVNVSGNFTVTTGARFNAGDTGRIAGAAVVNLNVTGNWALNGTGEFDRSTTGGTVTLNGTVASQDITSDTAGKTYRFHNLTIQNTTAAGVRVISSGGPTLNLSGTMSIPSGRRLDVSNQPTTIQVAGNWSQGGTFTATGSTVVFNGTGNQNITTAANFNVVDVNRVGEGAGTQLLAQGNLTLAGNLSVTAGTFHLGTALTHTVTGTVTVSGSLNLGTSSLAPTGNVTVNEGGTLTMNGDATNRAVLRMAAGALNTVLTINGTLRALQSGANPLKSRIQSNNGTAGPWYDFVVGDSAGANATWDVVGLEIANLRATGAAATDGMVFNSDTTFVRFDSVDYQAQGNGTNGALNQHVRNNVVAGSSITCNNVTYDATGTFAVNDTATTTGTFRMTFQGGPFGDSWGTETGDTEIAAPGRIIWIRTLTWDGGDPVNDFWSDATNWSPNAVPTSSDECVVLLANAKTPLIDANGVANKVTVQNTGDVRFTAGAFDLTVSGNYEIQAGGKTTMTAAGSDLFVGGSWIDANPAGPNGLEQASGAGVIRFTGTGSNNTIGSEPEFRRVEISGEYRLADGATVVLLSGASTTFTVLAGATFRGGPSGAAENATPARFVVNADPGETPWVHSSAVDFDPDNSVCQFVGGTAVSPAVLPANRPTAAGSIFYDLEIGDGTTTTVFNTNGPIVVLRDLIVRNAATLRVVAAGHSITIGGNLTIEGSGNIDLGVVAGNQLITFHGATRSTQSVSIAATSPFVFEDLTIDNGAPSTITWSLATNATVIGTTTCGAAEAIDLNTSTLTVRGAWNEGTSTLIPDTGTFELDVMGQEVPYTNFYNLRLRGAATYTLKPDGDNTTDVANTLDIGAGSTLDSLVGPPSQNLTIGGHWIRAGSFLARSGSVTFNGTGDQEIQSAMTGGNAFNNLVVNKATGTLRIGPATADATDRSVTISGVLTLTRGTFNLGVGTTAPAPYVVTVSGATYPSVDLNGGALFLNASQLVVSNAAGGVDVGTGATLDMTGVAPTAVPELDVEGSVAITGGTLNLSSSAAQVYVAGSWTHTTGTVNLTGSTSTIRFDATAGSPTIDVPASGTVDFVNVELNTTQTVSLAGASIVDVSSNVTILDGDLAIGGLTLVCGNLDVDQDDVANVPVNVVSVSTGTARATGNVDYAAGTFRFTGAGRLEIAGSLLGGATGALDIGTGPFFGTVEFTNTTAAQTIPSVDPFNHVEIDKQGGTPQDATPDGGLTLRGNLLVTSGRFVADGGLALSHTMDGTLTVASGATLLVQRSQITVNNSVGAPPPATAVSNNGTISLSNLNTTNFLRFFGNLVFGPGATLDVQTGTLDANDNSAVTGDQGDVNVSAAGAVLSFNGTTGRLEIEGALALADTSSLSESAGTIVFDGPRAQTIASTTYHHLQVNKTLGTTAERTATAAGALTIGGNFTLASGFFNPGGFTHVVLGNWDDSAASGGFVATAGTVRFAGTSAQTIMTRAAATFNTFFNLDIGDGVAASNVTVAVGQSLRVGGTLTVRTNATLNVRQSPAPPDHHRVTGPIVVQDGATLDVRADAGNGVLECLSTAATPDVDIDGTLSMADRGVLRFASDAEVEIDGTGALDGTLIASATTTALKPILQHAGSDLPPTPDDPTPPGYFFVRLVNATVNVNGLTVDGAGYDTVASYARGLELRGAETSVLAMNNLRILNVERESASGGIALHLDFTAALAAPATITLSNLAYDNTFDGAGTPSAAPRRGNVWAGANTGNNAITVTVSNPRNGAESAGRAPATEETKDWDEQPDAGNTLPGTEVNFENAYVWVGGAPGGPRRWDLGGNWSGGLAPVSPNPVGDVIIPDTANDPILTLEGGSPFALARNLTVETAATLTLGNAASPSPELRVSGNFVTQGTGVVIKDAAYVGRVLFNGSSAQNVDVATSDADAAPFYNLSVANTGAAGVRVLVKRTMNVLNDVAIDDGELALAAGVTVTAGTGSAGTRTVSIGSATTASLVLTNGTFTVDPDATITNNANGTITWEATGTGTLRIECPSFTQNGTFTPGNGTVIYASAGGAARSLRSGVATQYWHLSTTASAAQTWLVADGDLIVRGDLTIGANTTLDVDPNGDGVAPFNNITAQGNWTRNGTFLARMGTVTMNGAGAQEIRTASNFYNLTKAGAGTVTIQNAGGKMTVANSLTVSAGTLNLGLAFSGANAHEVQGTTFPSVLVNGGTLDLNTSSLLVNGAGGGVNITSGTIDVTDVSPDAVELDVTGNFSISGGTLLANAATSVVIRVGGNWSQTAGTFTVGASTVVMRPPAATIRTLTTVADATADFFHLSIDSTDTAGRVQVESTILDVDGTVTLTLGTLEKGPTPATTTIRVGLNWSNGGADRFVETNTTVVFDGTTSATVDAETFNNFTVSKSLATLTANGRLQVSGTWTVTGGTLDLGTGFTGVNAHTASGNPGTPAATVVLSGGTMRMNGSALAVSGPNGGIEIQTGATLDLTTNPAGGPDIDCAGIFNINGGTFTMSGSAATVEVGGNWTDSGTFTLTDATGTVTLKGTAKTIGVPADTTRLDFPNLSVSGTYTVNAGDVDVSGNLTIAAAGRLDLDNGTGRTHEVTGNVTVTAGSGSAGGILNVSASDLTISTATATFTVQAGTTATGHAQLLMEDNSSLILGTDATSGVAVTISGTFDCDVNASGSGAAKPVITRTGTGRFSFVINGTAGANGTSVRIGGLAFSFATAQGMRLRTTPNTLAVQRIDFTNALSGATGRHMTLVNFTGTHTWPNCSFDSSFGAGRNVEKDSVGSPNGVVTFTQFSGAGGGDDFDLDPGISQAEPPGDLRWSRTARWTGASVTDGSWFRTDNWDGGFVPDSLTDVFIAEVDESLGRFNAVVPTGASPAQALSLTIEDPDPAADPTPEGGQLTLSSTNDLIVGVGGVTIQSGGDLAISNAGAELRCDGDWSDPGLGVSQTAGIIRFNGVNKQLLSGRAATVDIPGTYTIPSAATFVVTGALTVPAGGGLTLVRSAGRNGATLELGNTATATVNGSFTTTAVSPQPHLVWPENNLPRVRPAGGTGTFDMNLLGATVAINGLDFSGGDAEGLNIGKNGVTNSTITGSILDNVRFHTGSAAGRHLSIAHDGPIALRGPSCFFDASTTNNVRLEDVNGGTDVSAIFADDPDPPAPDYNGTGAGTARELEVNTARIDWIVAAVSLTSSAGPDETPTDPSTWTGVQGFPNSHWNWNTGTFVAHFVPVRQTGDDAIVALNEEGREKYRMSVSDASFGQVNGPCWTATMGSNTASDRDVVIFGTTLGYLFVVEDTGTALVNVAPYPLRPKTTAGIDNCTRIDSPILYHYILDGAPPDPAFPERETSRFYFSGANGASNNFYTTWAWRVGNEGRAISASWPVPAGAPSRSWPAYRDLGGGNEALLVASDVAAGSGHFYKILIGTGGIDGDYTASANHIRGGIGQEGNNVFLASFEDGVDGDSVYSLDISTSPPTQRWKQPAGSSNFDVLPYVTTGALFVGDFGGTMWSFNATTGTLNWSTPLEASPIRSNILDLGGSIYFGNDNGKFYRLNGSTGALQTTMNFGAGRRLRSVSLADVGGVTVFLVGTDKGDIFIVRP